MIRSARFNKHIVLAIAFGIVGLIGALYALKDITSTTGAIGITVLILSLFGFSYLAQSEAAYYKKKCEELKRSTPK